MYFSPLFKQVWQKCGSDSCLDLAAQVSFYFVLSTFPFLLVMAGLLGWISTTSGWVQFAQWLTTYLPARTQYATLTMMLELSKGYGAFLSFGLILTVWSASTGFLSLMDALSVAFGVKERRSYFKRRMIAICATIMSALFVLMCFGIWNMGHFLAGLIGNDFRYFILSPLQWRAARWIATLLVICLGVDLINYFLPGSRQPWRWITPGTAFTVLAFVLASVLLNLFITHNPDVSRIYGALTGFIFLMLWIYVASLSLLVGAETDAAARELAGPEAMA